MTTRTALAVAAMLLGIAAILASVGGPAAVASYHHAYEVFRTYGEAESRAAWLPLTTDGMLIAALVVMYSRRWAQQPIGFVPWLAFGVGFIGTIAANLASADAFGAPSVGEGVGRLAAAVWAPISFAVTLELVAVMLGRVRDYVARMRADVDTTWPVTHLVGIPVSADPERIRDAIRVEQRDAIRDAVGAALAARPTTRVEQVVSRPVPAVADPATRPDRKAPTRVPATRNPARPAGSTRVGDPDDPATVAWIGSEWDRVGRPPTAKAVREHAGCGGSKATRLLAQARDARPAVRPVPAPVEQDAESAS